MSFNFFLFLILYIYIFTFFIHFKQVEILKLLNTKPRKDSPHFGYRLEKGRNLVSIAKKGEQVSLLFLSCFSIEMLIKHEVN